MGLYFPMSQEFNSDPEGWELTEKLGDRSVRTWIEILSILDRNQNVWKLVPGWDSVISRKVRQSPASVRSVVGWTLAKGWLMVGQVSADGSPEILHATNFAKYHKKRSEISPPPNLTYPNLTNLTKEILKKDKNSLSGFAEFWASFPKKVGKGSAEKAWLKVTFENGTRDHIMAALENQKTCEQWQKDNGQFIPHPATWLNQRRWEDEPVQQTEDDEPGYFKKLPWPIKPKENPDG